MRLRPRFLTWNPGIWGFINRLWRTPGILDSQERLKETLPVSAFLGWSNSEEKELLQSQLLMSCKAKKDVDALTSSLELWYSVLLSDAFFFLVSSGEKLSIERHTDGIFFLWIWCGGNGCRALGLRATYCKFGSWGEMRLASPQSMYQGFHGPL